MATLSDHELMRIKLEKTIILSTIEDLSNLQSISDKTLRKSIQRDLDMLHYRFLEFQRVCGFLKINF